MRLVGRGRCRAGRYSVPNTAESKVAHGGLTGVLFGMPQFSRLRDPAASFSLTTAVGDYRHERRQANLAAGVRAVGLVIVITGLIEPAPRPDRDLAVRGVGQSTAAAHAGRTGRCG